MAGQIEIKVPDIGGAKAVDVIEVLVKVGDVVAIDTPLLTLESDKASMEIPCPMAGTVLSVALKVGDKVDEGDVILSLETEASSAIETVATANTSTEIPAMLDAKRSDHASMPVTATAAAVSTEVFVPDIGGATDVDVIELSVKVGDEIIKDQALITLEGDKATMDIPSPFSGKVQAIHLAVGQKVSKGTLILSMQTSDATDAPKSSSVVENKAPDSPKSMATDTITAVKHQAISDNASSASFVDISAGPAVRRMARELGVVLSQVKGSGRKGRVSKEDLQSYVKQKLSEKPAAMGLPITASAEIDFSRFGEIEKKPLSKIKRLTGMNVHRSWVTIPQVTQFDEADITELEAFRKGETDTAARAGYKLTMLAFVCKVVAKALQAFPQFNASLDSSAENLIYKRFINIGIAVETPNGLVVPVIQAVDKLSIGDIAQEMARLSVKARDKGLSLAEMSGGCFTISSLGGIGGTAFTPIVNGPEVAILGLSRTSTKPVYDGRDFLPRLMLPLSLSYDHRVIDGAEAARFTRFIAEQLSDIRRVLL